MLTSNFTKVPQGNGVTILIPFHNEENNLINLWSTLHSLNGLSNEVELIFVNDYSDDNGVSILKNLINSTPLECSVKVVESPKRGKKSSIQTGVELSQYDYILLTDADVKLHRNWLLSMLTDLQNSDLVLGSVINKEQSLTFLNLIQDSEALMLEGIKTASIHNSFPLLASGASLGFRKDKFIASDPYANNLNILSGDDMFLLQVAKNENWLIHSNSNVPAETSGAKDFKSSIRQHRRWAAKTPALKMSALTIIGVLTILAHIGVVISLVLLIFNFNAIIVLSLIFKFLVEFLFLFSRAIIFNRLKLLFFAPIMFICYPFYLMAILIGLNKNKTNW
ncbi:MAG: biofilm PGA synthesis N-glycosyltransferase PgaC [Parvicella sp.]|jgi:biofilm PGA synthesis N-glycosyltransferase PgaC